MNGFDLNTKRQLLTDLLVGKTDALRRYRANLQQVNSPYTRIINDEVNGLVYGIGKDGGQHPLTVEDLIAVPPNLIVTIVDYSGGKPIPGIDEDYYQPTGL